MQVMPDHIHLFISIPVDISISFSIQQLKGFSALYKKKITEFKKKIIVASRIFVRL